MAITYGFYNSVDGDRKYTAEQMSRLFDGIIEDGVYSAIGDRFRVTAAGGMKVNVGSGRAWFDHTWTLNDSAIEVSFGAASALNDRLDAVCIEVRDGDSDRENRIVVVKGSPAENPQRPTVKNVSGQHQHPIAYVRIVKGSTAITSSNITNVVGTSVCPYVTGAAQSISIDDYVAALEAEWKEWEDAEKASYVSWINSLKDLADDEAVLKLQNQIDALKSTATSNTAGLMSAADKTKLDSMTVMELANSISDNAVGSDGKTRVIGTEIAQMIYNLITDNSTIVDQYIIFPNGLHIEWGMAQVSYRNASILGGEIKFKKPFTSTNYIAIGQAQSTGNSPKELQENIKMTSKSTTSVQIYMHNARNDYASSATSYAGYIAIGY